MKEIGLSELASAHDSRIEDPGLEIRERRKQEVDYKDSILPRALSGIRQRQINTKGKIVSQT